MIRDGERPWLQRQLVDVHARRLGGVGLVRLGIGDQVLVPALPDAFLAARSAEVHASVRPARCRPRVGGSATASAAAPLRERGERDERQNGESEGGKTRSHQRFTSGTENTKNFDLGWSRMNGLRPLFGPSKREIWRQLSADIGGEFVDGGVWRGSKVHGSHGEWTVTLDTYTVPVGKAYVTFTRMRAPYANPDGFRFTIYRKSIFSGIATMLGMQDIRIGDPSFDDEFVIKGTH